MASNQKDNQELSQDQGFEPVEYTDDETQELKTNLDKMAEDKTARDKSEVKIFRVKLRDGGDQ